VVQISKLFCCKLIRFPTIKNCQNPSIFDEVRAKIKVTSFYGSRCRIMLRLETSSYKPHSLTHVAAESDVTYWNVSDLSQWLVRTGTKSWYLSFHEDFDDFCVTLNCSLTGARSRTLALVSSAAELKSSCTAWGMFWGNNSGHFCCSVRSVSPQFGRADMPTVVHLSNASIRRRKWNTT